MPTAPALRLASRAREVRPSATLAMAARASALAAAGRDILSMSAGEPDFPTPAAVRAAAAAAIARGETRYTPVAGTRAVREAVARDHQRTYGQTPALDEVVVGTGGKQILFNALAAVVDGGDEVLIPSPYWVSYPDMVRLVGGVPRPVAAAAAGRLPSAQSLAAHAGPRARGVVLNSPSNPSGLTYAAEDLRAIAEWLRQRPDIWVISDEIYSGLVYDGPFVGLLHVAPELAPRLMIASGVSKTYAMTGWRIGFGVGPRAWVAAMTDVQGATTSGACSIAQAAAAAALTGPQDEVLAMRQAFARRRDRIVAGLGGIDGVAVVRPHGAFYVMVEVGGDDAALAEALLEKEGLAVVPGGAFGAPGFVRLSFACSEAQIDEGVRRLGRGLARRRAP